VGIPIKTSAAASKKTRRRGNDLPLENPARRIRIRLMQAAPLAVPAIALKPKPGTTPREQFAAQPISVPTSTRYVPSNSEPEPTEGDTPLEEAWFRYRPDIIEGIKRGLADMAAGRGVYLGSFAEYADLDWDDDES